MEKFRKKKRSSVKTKFNKTIAVMKLIILLAIIGALQVHAVVYSQNNKLDLNAENLELREVLKELEENSNFRFFYSENLINLEKKVNIVSKDATIEEVLNELLKDSNLTYRLFDENLVIITAAESEKQGINIKGRVVNSNGTPLPGVNIVEKGTNNGTVTDLDGYYSINVSDENATLVFSYVGYLAEETDLNGRTTLDISLVEDIEELDEVVVIGYGAVKKRDLTGAVASVKTDDVHIQPISGFDQAMQGMVAGMQITQGSAEPGGGSTIRIRGGNSLLGGNEPLFVIDGFPIYSNIQQNQASGSGTGGTSSTNPLAMINPNDIESIEILKDASATSIYGARGANGVIIITTKRGREGKTRVNYDGYYGIQEVARKIDMFNGEQHAKFHNDFMLNKGDQPIFDGNILPTPEQIGEGTDWQDQIFQTAPIQSHNLSISGGANGTRFAFSGNYFNQEGVVKSSAYQKGSFRVNLDHDVSKRISIGSHLFYSRSKKEGDVAETGMGNNRGVVFSALSISPTLPVYREDGSYSINKDIPERSSNIDNPVKMAELIYDNTLSDRLLADAFININILSGLSFKSSIGTNYYNSDRNVYYPNELLLAEKQNGRASQSKANVFSWINENILTYQKNFGNNHDLNVVGGFSIQEEELSKNFIRVYGFVSDDLKSFNLGAGDDPQPPSSSKSGWTLASWIGRVNYTLMNKYLFTFTARADGSSKFGKNNKWAFFPSGAVAWRLSDEEFMSNLDWLYNLKIRTSYGTTGNSEIGSYQSLPRLNSARYSYNDQMVIGFVPANIANPDLKWETTSMFDVGIDLGVWDNRLRLVADYYYKETTDLLLNRSVPWSSGFSSALENRGVIENKGYEITLGANIFDGNFKWALEGNISGNKNEIIDLGDSEEFFTETIAHSGVIKYSQGSLVRVGEPVGVYYVLVNDGTFQNEQQLADGPTMPGDKVGWPRYVDKNDDGQIDDDDRFVYGDPNPDYIYGITNRFSFKGLELSVLVTGVKGNMILNLLRARGARLRPHENQISEMLDYWTPENPNTELPMANDTEYQRFSSRNFEDGTHWRIKNLTLSYDLPFSIQNVSQAKVYFGTQNLYINSDYTGFDPDVNSGGRNAGPQDNFNRGVDRVSYPSARSYILGLNVSF